MEVTKSNFQELLPDIEEAIKSSSFLCVDGEFTGLNDGTNITAFDTPSQYYDKLRQGALDFLFVQFGLAAFQYDSENKIYRCKCYNFYVFPRPLNHCAPDSRFLCQSSSMDFLATNGFDFNKLFKEGIPYLNQSGERLLRETLAAKRKYVAANNASTSPARVPPQHLKQVESACNKLEKLLSEDCKEEQVSIDKCSAFVRKLIYKRISERFGDRIAVETKQGVLVGRRRDEPAPTALQLEKEGQDKDDADVDSAIGFSKVIRAIAGSGKLVVGHNMLLDLCHMVHQFCDPLPTIYGDFKEMIHHIFPYIIDTKLMCHNEPLKELIKSSALKHVLQTTSEEPFLKPEVSCEEGYCYEVETGQLHEAGYDAFITGLVFISLFNYLKKTKKRSRRGMGEGEEVGKPLLGEDVGNIKQEASLKPYLNKLFLMKALDTYISLGHDDPNPCRDHVFYVSVPTDWNNQSISQLFSAFGGVQISWVNSGGAWVALYDKKEASRAIKSLTVKGAVLPKGVQVVMYTKHSGSGTTRSADSDHVKRKPPRDMSPPQAVSNTKKLKPADYRENGIGCEEKEKKKDRKRPGDCLAELEMGAKSKGASDPSPTATSLLFPLDDTWD